MDDRRRWRSFEGNMWMRLRESRSAEVRPPAGNKRPATVRSILLWLVLVCLFPGVIGSSAILYISYRSERAQLERDTIQTARALMQAVDAELTRAEAAALALSTSGYLVSRDFGAFYAQAKDLLQRTELGSNFVLSDASGQQLVNTVRPFPGPLPRHGNPDQLRRVFDSGKPVISDVYIGGVLRRPVMSIDVPVLRDGKVIYDLSIGLFPERLGRIPRAQHLPSDWVVAIFDTQGVIAARTHAAEQFVGQRGAPALLRRMAETDEGMVETATLEGTEVSAVFSRSPSSKWAVAIGIPTGELTADLRQRFALLLGAVVILITLGIALAVVLGERIASSIRALVAPALALGSGEPVAVLRDHLRESEEVGAAISTAAELLAHRTSELEAANRELQEFSYAISHDLSTPLRAIAGYAQLVVEDHGSQLDEEGRRMLAGVRDGTVRMGKLIDSLVDFMGIARRKLDRREVDMNELVRTVFERQRNALPPRRLRLEVGDLPPAWGDREMLRRVLDNLLTNAIKFIPVQADGLIVVAGEIVGGATVYKVIDNGVGFDMRYANKLFEVFEHLHSPEEFAGLGVGLAIVKRIVGRHGGRVWAEGKVGAGATFCFSIPGRK
jgi:signal transduction histidine kinase